ncbi:MAG TPA: carboxypeptidase-like regulatory domain-containing protein [Candidatus Tumulicola sp.]
MTTSFLTGVVSAETTGALRGVVTDQRHAPVAGATVVATSPAQREETVTDAAGHFVFISLVPATYAVTITRREFGTIAIQDVAVSADATTSMVARMSRVFWLIDGMQVRQKAALVQPGRAADAYVIPSYWPLYDVNGTNIYALHFVPGLTFGPGPELSR